MRHMLWLALTLFAATPAAGQTFEIPEGFQHEIVRETDAEGGHIAVLRVMPEPGAFSQLSSIEMRPLSENIAYPADWLDGRMTAFLNDTEAADVESVLNAPDSPLADPAFEPLTEILQAAMDHLRRLGQAPLKYCDVQRRGENAVGVYDELACRFTIGPLGWYLVLRLQELDGVWYYTRIATMNKKRLRHLVAIANSFHVE